VQVIKLLIILVSPFFFYLCPFRPKYSPQHTILKHLSLHSSLNLSDQVSHPYKTTGKIIVLYIFFFIFLNNILEDKSSAWNDSKHSLNSICSYFLPEYNFDSLRFFPKNLNSTLSKKLLSIFILWPHAPF
jgi:hypothetical protein